MTVAHVRVDDYVSHQVVCPRCGLLRAYTDMRAAARDVMGMGMMGIIGRTAEACQCEGLCQCPAN